MGFWRTLGRLGHKIGGGASKVLGGISGSLELGAAGLAATGIGAPIGAAMAALGGEIGVTALGAKAIDIASYGADKLGNK